MVVVMVVTFFALMVVVAFGAMDVAVMLGGLVVVVTLGTMNVAVVLGGLVVVVVVVVTLGAMNVAVVVMVVVVVAVNFYFAVFGGLINRHNVAGGVFFAISHHFQVFAHALDFVEL